MYSFASTFPFLSFDVFLPPRHSTNIPISCLRWSPMDDMPESLISPELNLIHHTISKCHILRFRKSPVPTYESRALVVKSSKIPLHSQFLWKRQYPPILLISLLLHSRCAWPFQKLPLFSALEAPEISFWKYRDWISSSRYEPHVCVNNDLPYALLYSLLPMSRIPCVRLPLMCILTDAIFVLAAIAEIGNAFLQSKNVPCAHPQEPSYIPAHAQAYYLSLRSEQIP